MARKTYFFVRERKSGKIIQILEFDPTMFSDISEFYKDLSERQKMIFSMYPPDEFDLSEGTGEDMTDLMEAFPEFRGSEALETVRKKLTPFEPGAYEELIIRYQVAPNEEDRVQIKAVVAAAKIPITKLGRRLSSTGGGGKVNSVEELQITARTDEGKQVEVSSFVSEGDAVITVHLWPPVRDGEVRRVEIEYLWSGIWNPLRTDGSDCGIEVLGRPARFMEIAITVPKALGDVEFRSRKPDVGTVVKSSGEQNGGTTLAWQVPNATPGRYSYDIARKA